MKHASHPHELYVAPNMDNQNLTCFGCKLTIFGPCYACSSCNIYLHKFCFELPQSTQFELHSEHTLGLLYPPYTQGPCEACGEPCNGCFTYNCTLCNFNVHANCATLLQPDPQNSRDQYVTVFLAHNMMAMKSLKSQLGGVNGTQQQNEEAELARRRHNLTMQRLKQASDSIDFMGQIGTSNYTYRYF